MDRCHAAAFCVSAIISSPHLAKFSNSFVKNFQFTHTAASSFSRSYHQSFLVFHPKILSRSKSGSTISASAASSSRKGSVLPREKLLKTAKARGVTDNVAERAVELAERSILEWKSNILSQFLDPKDSQELISILGSVPDLGVVSWGGYSSAERTLLMFTHADTLLTLISTQTNDVNAEADPDEKAVSKTKANGARSESESASLNDTSRRQLFDSELKLMSISGNFLFDSASHRDFLGAILNCGITRESVGDIIVLGDRGAQAIVRSDVCEFLCGTLTSVRSVTVKCEVVSFDELKVKAPTRKDLTTVEASMRIDAVASAAFGMSRSKMSALVKDGQVKVNWKEVSSTSTSVKSGDIISVRGKGRAEIKDVNVTAKNRFRIAISRFT